MATEVGETLAFPLSKTKPPEGSEQRETSSDSDVHRVPLASCEEDCGGRMGPAGGTEGGRMGPKVIRQEATGVDSIRVGMAVRGERDRF